MVLVVLEYLQKSERHGDIIYYLQNLWCLDHTRGSKRSLLWLNAPRYYLTKEGIDWRNLDDLILRCVDPLEVQKLMNEMHNEFFVGHFASKTTTQNLKS
jgi:hypothetical protein